MVCVRSWEACCTSSVRRYRLTLRWCKSSEPCADFGRAALHVFAPLLQLIVLLLQIDGLLVQLVALLLQLIAPPVQFAAYSQHRIGPGRHASVSRCRVLTVHRRIGALRCHAARRFSHARRARALPRWHHHPGIHECSPEAPLCCRQVFVHRMAGDAERPGDVRVRRIVFAYHLEDPAAHRGERGHCLRDECLELGMFDHRRGRHPCVHLVVVPNTGHRASVTTIGRTGHVQGTSDRCPRTSGCLRDIRLCGATSQSRCSPGAARCWADSSSATPTPPSLEIEKNA